MEPSPADSEKCCQKEWLCCGLCDIHSFGLITLNETCVLDAYFDSNHYDSFKVKDSSALKKAIARVNTRAALYMGDDLHMTVCYPRKGVVPGLSKADAVTFANYEDFPVVQLLVNEIHVSRDGKFGTAVIAGIDSAALFKFNNNGTPAHITLWGNPPVMAGRQLIGLPLALRSPFIQVTAEQVGAGMAAKSETLNK